MFDRYFGFFGCFLLISCWTVFRPLVDILMKIWLFWTMYLKCKFWVLSFTKVDIQSKLGTKLKCRLNTNWMRNWMNKFTGTSYIYPLSIICSYSRTLISIEILVTSCNFAAKLWSSSAFRQFLRHGNSNLVLVINHDHIISFRRPFVSSQAGSRYYFSLSNWKYFPVFLLWFVKNRRGDDADVNN